MKTLIKICGIASTEALGAAARAGATHIGLVHFDKSPRHVSLEQAAALRAQTPPSLKVVLLLVNAEAALTEEAIQRVRPDVVQFHGSETPEWLALVKKHMKVEVWKALGVKDAATLKQSDRYLGVTDRLLFDAPAQALPGGNGTRVDWSVLQGYNHRMPWGLAGGLDPDNVAEAMRVTRAPLIDVSSGVESAPGVKDVDKIAAFCNAVQHYERT
jgi:phosphoribosylanthranilate isomerase